VHDVSLLFLFIQKEEENLSLLLIVFSSPNYLDQITSSAKAGGQADANESLL
jgi:hypothetical protein